MVYIGQAVVSRGYVRQRKIKIGGSTEPADTLIYSTSLNVFDGVTSQAHVVGNGTQVQQLLWASMIWGSTAWLLNNGTLVWGCK